MKLSSKAKTLKKIRLKNSIIPPLYSFNVSDYKKNKIKILSKIRDKFEKNVAVRSSNFAEDSSKNSYAGYFKSFLNVKISDKFNLDKKINEVINSYKNHKSYKNQVFIQEMVQNVTLSGVAASCDSRTLSPYTIIEFNLGEDTSIVTSGKSNTSTFKYIDIKTAKTNNKKILNLIKSIEEIKNIVKNKNIEIEFAIDNKKVIYILQIRYLITSDNLYSITKNQLLKSLKKLEKKY